VLERGLAVKERRDMFSSRNDTVVSRRYAVLARNLAVEERRDVLLER
jgi:hypothetical protein